jgi:hypothetical protein
LGNGLTLVGWIKPETIGIEQVVVAKYDYGLNDRGYRLDLRPSNKIGFLASSNGTLQNDYKLELTAPETISVGKWYHLAAVFDAQQKTMIIYLNGNVVGSKPVPGGAIKDTAAPFMLGANLSNKIPAQFFDGLLDEWRVYKGALSQSEIQSLRDATLPTPTPVPTGVPTNTPTPTQTPTPGTTPQPVPVSCNPTGGSGGLQPGTYHTTVAGLNAIVVVGKGYQPQNPTYLGFFIHGDGGLYRQIEKSSNPITQFANQHGWILVSPQAPNGSSWWANWQGDHLQALAGVLDQMFAKYNVCRNIVFGTTGSGGSEFWTSQFFPNKGGQYPAHTVIACGGSGGNATKLAALAKNPDTVARSTFHYVYGTADNLYPGILRSITSYRNAGFNVYTEEIQNAGHCNVWPNQGLPTWPEWTVTFWTQMAGRLGVDLLTLR